MTLRAYRLVSMFALAVLALSGMQLRAGVFTSKAYDNGTILAAGPRSLPNGRNFFNTEGTNNGPFATFSVADFASTHFRDANGQPIGQISQINSISLVLTQHNAGFTTDGQINFYVTRQLITSIDWDPNFVETFFDVNDVNGEGLNGQFAPLAQVGTGLFVQVQNGQVDTFLLTLDSDTQNYLISVINNLGSFRIIITPADPNVSATYSGFTDLDTTGMVNYTGPVIMLDAN